MFRNIYLVEKNEGCCLQVKKNEGLCIDRCDFTSSRSGLRQGELSWISGERSIHRGGPKQQRIYVGWVANSNFLKLFVALAQKLITGTVGTVPVPAPWSVAKGRRNLKKTLSCEKKGKLLFRSVRSHNRTEGFVVLVGF